VASANCAFSSDVCPRAQPIAAQRVRNQQEISFVKVLTTPA
jgi:hypothetical protein